MTEGIELPDQEKIKILGEKENYMHLGILEAYIIKQVEMKEKEILNVSLDNEKTPRNQAI